MAASPLRDVASAGHGKITGGAKIPGSISGAKMAALVRLAQRQRIGSGAALTPHPTANLGPSMPVVNAGDNDGDEMPTPGPKPSGVVVVAAHTRAKPRPAGY